MGGKLGDDFKNRKQLFLAFDQQAKDQGYIVKAENAKFFTITRGVCEVDCAEYIIAGRAVGTFLAKFPEFRKKDFKYTYAIMYNQYKQKYTNVKVYY